MAKPHQRVFAFIGAVLFLATSVAVSAVVVWQVRQQNQAQKELDKLETAQSQQQPIQCSQSPQQDQPPKEGKLQGTKLENFTPTDKVPELQCIDLKVGEGETVKAGDTITADYTGAYVATGIIFESSKDSGQPATFPLSGVIQGWQEGVPGMKTGGVRRLVIPGQLAYGDAPEGYTPGDGGRPMGPLVFDIELIKIGQ